MPPGSLRSRNWRAIFLAHARGEVELAPYSETVVGLRRHICLPGVAEEAKAFSGAARRGCAAFLLVTIAA